MLFRLIRHYNIIHFLRTGNKVIAAVAIFAFCACKKDKEHYGNPATVQILNVLDDGIDLRANLSDTHPITYNVSLLLYNK